MAIIVNKHGHSLNYFGYLSRLDEVDYVSDICGATAIIIHQNKVILCWNKYRNNWELPGGGKEKGEDLKQCIIREVFEEVSQKVENLEIRCLYKVFVPRIKKEIIGVTFYGELKELSTFSCNDEMSKMILWDMNKDIGYIDEVDKKIIEFVLRGNFDRV